MHVFVANKYMYQLKCLFLYLRRLREGKKDWKAVKCFHPFFVESVDMLACGLSGVLKDIYSKIQCN